MAQPQGAWKRNIALTFIRDAGLPDARWIRKSG